MKTTSFNRFVAAFLFSTVPLLATPQVVFDGTFSAGSWEAKEGVTLSAPEKGPGVQSTWALSKEIPYGWFRTMAERPGEGAKALRVKLKGDPLYSLEVVLADLTDKKKGKYWRHGDTLKASPAGSVFHLKLDGFKSDAGLPPTAQEMTKLRVIMFKAKGSQKYVVTIQELAYVGAEDFTEDSKPTPFDMKKLLSMLDPKLPAMKPILEAEASGKRELALTLLAKHFRERTTPQWTYDYRKVEKGGPFSEKAAADGVAARFNAYRIDYTHPNGDINWGYNPTLGNPTATAEWVFHHARMGWWGDLSAAWWSTGESKYADAFVKQMTGFVKTQPCPSSANENAGSCWREIEAGQRMQVSWANSFLRFMTAPEFTDEALLTMVRSMVEHAQLLQLCPPREGNHHIIGLCGLHTVGCLLPEFTNAKAWRMHAIAELEKPFHNRKTGWLEDGMWFERAPGYHQWLVGKYAGILRVAQTAGFLGEVPDIIKNGMQKAIEIEVVMSAPDRTRPEVNDCNAANWLKMNFSEGLSLYPGSVILKWAASVQSNTPLPPPPEVVDYHLKQSGYLMTRSGAQTNDSFVLFDTGDLGGWHGHKDKLNLIAWFDGVEWLYDNGGGDYDVTPFRSYAFSTRSHSTVMVDGLNQFRPYTEEDPAGTDRKETPEPKVSFLGQRTEATAWFVGGYTEYDRQDKGEKDFPIFRHRREIVFLKPRTLVVVDTLFPPDKASHMYDQRWQTRSPEFTVLKGNSATLVGKEGSDRLLVLPLERKGLDVTGHVGEKDPIIGWDVVHGANPVPALTLCHVKKASGPVRFVTLLTTVKSEQETPAVTAAGSDGWSVKWPNGRTLSVTCGPSEAGGVTVKE